MAQNVTINGADYPSVPRIDVPITGTQNLAQFFDTSDADASADDVLTGKVFYNALGKIIGTGSGGGGLEYEEGTWTTSSNIARPTIQFSKTHSKMPAFAAMMDATNNQKSSTNLNVAWMYLCYNDMFGADAYYNATARLYGLIAYMYKSSSATSMTQAATYLQYPSSNAGSSSSTYPRYHVTESAIMPNTNSTSRYWVSGRTYKWFALWR